MGSPASYDERPPKMPSGFAVASLGTFRTFGDDEVVGIISSEGQDLLLLYDQHRLGTLLDVAAVPGSHG
jgi:hypothetical protein